MAPGAYVVIFASTRTADDQVGYDTMAEAMGDLARAQPGFLGMQSVRGDDGVGITVCYWTSAEAIAAWKRDVDHAAAQRQGQEGALVRRVLGDGRPCGTALRRREPPRPLTRMVL